MSDDTQRDEVWRRIGDLEGEQRTIKDEQAWTRAKLNNIDDHLQALNRKVSWLMGGIAVVVALSGAAGWYMAQAGIAPLDGVQAESQEM